MAVLIDEFGGMAGVVTATDIVESVMGEVPGDGGETTQKFVTRTDGSILIDGMVSLFDLKERLQIDLDEFSDVSQTLSGLVMHVGKSIPKEGQSVLCKDWKFEVVDMDGNRIDKVLASRQELQVVIPEGLTHENSHSR